MCVDDSGSTYVLKASGRVVKPAAPAAGAKP